MDKNSTINKCLAIDLKRDLVNAYKIIAYLQYEDLTYTHISVRSEEGNSFYILPFGFLFAEAEINLLLKVDFEGNIIEGEEKIYNKTGFVIHGVIYQKRQDINSIFHLHTIDGIAVSSMECGLLPISQFSMPFFENISYHEYNSLALEDDVHGNAIANDLGENNAMLLKAHGTITCGKTTQEAFFFTRFLEQACRVQVKLLATNQRFAFIDDEICQKAKTDMLTFEKNLGSRDFKAMVRLLKLE